jgi:hypothetical protein
VRLRLSDHWRIDGNRKQRMNILGPVAWYVALVLSVAGIGLVLASFVVLAFRWGGTGAWPIIAIMLVSIGIVAAASASVGWLARRRKRR